MALYSKQCSMKLEEIFLKPRGFSQEDTIALDFLLDEDFRDITQLSDTAEKNFFSYLIDLKRYSESGRLREEKYSLNEKKSNLGFAGIVTGVFGLASLYVSVLGYSGSNFQQGNVFAAVTIVAALGCYIISSKMKSIDSQTINLEKVQKIYTKIENMSYNGAKIKDMVRER